MSSWLLRIAVVGLVCAQVGSGAGPAQEQGAAPVAVRVLEGREARSLWLDLMGRPPFRAEMEGAVGEPFEAAVDGLLADAGFWRNWFEEQLYYFLLVNNFRPQSERLAAIPGELAKRALDVREAIHLIALSSNFEQRNPGADTFVTVVMEQLLGLEVQKNLRELEIGKHVYDGKEGLFLGMTGRNQSDVVRIAVANKAFGRHFVAREYERIVHRRMDAKELNGAATAFDKDATVFTGLVKQWLMSDAYRARLRARVALGNRLFVRALFVDLLDRMPSEEESEPMRQALDGLSDPVPLRSVLVRMMLDSGKVAVEKREAVKDPAGWIRRLFARFYGRAPSDAELAAFVAAWDDPGCRPQTILCALLSSAEYQQY